MGFIFANQLVFPFSTFPPSIKFFYDVMDDFVGVIYCLQKQNNNSRVLSFLDLIIPWDDSFITFAKFFEKLTFLTS